jgi:hypothetical protein
VFNSLTITGGAGAIVFGSRDAVRVSSWRITRTKAEGGAWMLSATIAWIDTFQARRAPLLFTAPRPGGFMTWPIEAMEIGETSLRAHLGPPER